MHGVVRLIELASKKVEAIGLSRKVADTVIAAAADLAEHAHGVVPARRQHDALAEDHPEVASVLLRHVTRVLADRLHRSSSGILRQVSDEQFRVEHVEHVEQNRSWLSRTLSWLVGASEAS